MIDKTNLDESLPHRSFEEVVVSKMKGPSTSKENVKRRRIDRKAKVMTDEEHWPLLGRTSAA